MERAAAFFSYVEFGKRDLVAVDVGLSASAVRNAFDGSWTAALEALRERLHEKGKELKPRNREVWTEQEMYEEMHRIWTQIGHRPSKDEWNAANPKISYNTYRRRFHGWENACLKLIEHQMHDYGQEIPQPQPKGAESNLDRLRLTPRRTNLSERRDPSQALINKVWKRDNFRCRRCGRSPATHFGVVLEVDHIVPFDLPPDPIPGVKVFVFISDVFPRMGGTLVVAGSHKLIRRALARIDPDTLSDTRRTRLQILNSHPWLQALCSKTGPHDRIKRFMESSDTVDGTSLRVVKLTGRAGEIVLTQPWLLHCQAPNCGAAPRFMRTTDIYRREFHQSVCHAGARPPNPYQASVVKRAAGCIARGGGPRRGDR